MERMSSDNGGRKSGRAALAGMAMLMLDTRQAGFLGHRKGRGRV